MKHFLDLADHGQEGALDLLALAEHLRERPEPAALAGRVLQQAKNRLVLQMAVLYRCWAAPPRSCIEARSGRDGDTSQ